MKSILAAIALLLLMAGEVSGEKSQANAAKSIGADKECGAITTYIACITLRPEILPYKDFLGKLGPPGAGGYSVDQLESYVRSLGLYTAAVRTSTNGLRSRLMNRDSLAIIRVDNNHFVLVTRIDDLSVEILDFPKKEILKRDAFEKRWLDSSALIVADVPIGEPSSQKLGMLTIAAIAVGVFALGSFLWGRYRQRSIALVLVFGLIVSGCSRPVDSSVTDSAASNNLPKVVITPETFDLGFVTSGDTINLTAKIQNVGLCSAHIPRVTTPCSCSQARLSKNELSPGESVDLNLRVTPSFGVSSTILTIQIEGGVSMKLPILWDCSKGIKIGDGSSVILGSLDHGRWHASSLSVEIDSSVVGSKASEMIFEGQPSDLLRVAYDEEKQCLACEVNAEEIGQFQAVLRVLKSNGQIVAERPVLWRVDDSNQIKIVNGKVIQEGSMWKTRCLVLASSPQTPTDFQLRDEFGEVIRSTVVERSDKSWWLDIEAKAPDRLGVSLRVILCKTDSGSLPVAETNLSLE